MMGATDVAGADVKSDPCEGALWAKEGAAAAAAVSERTGGLKREAGASEGEDESAGKLDEEFEEEERRNADAANRQ